MTCRQSHALTIIEAQLDILEEVTDRQIDEKRAHAVLARMFALVWQMSPSEASLALNGPGDELQGHDDMPCSADVTIRELTGGDEVQLAFVYPRSDQRPNPGTDDFNRFMDGVMPD